MNFYFNKFKGLYFRNNCEPLRKKQTNFEQTINHYKSLRKGMYTKRIDYRDFQYDHMSK